MERSSIIHRLHRAGFEIHPKPLTIEDLLAMVLGKGTRISVNLIGKSAYIHSDKFLDGTSILQVNNRHVNDHFFIMDGIPHVYREWDGVVEDVHIHGHCRSGDRVISTYREGSRTGISYTKRHDEPSK